MKPDATVQKAVFPVAGLGTRFLPATKASPKEMLAVVEGGSSLYRASRIVLLLASVLAIAGGGVWSAARIG